MPDIDTASKITKKFSTLDLKFAYRQLNMDPEAANPCDFNIIDGNMTGTYRLKT